MSRVVGRQGLLDEVRDLLEQGLSVALHGPSGIGRSTLLDSLEADFLRDPANGPDAVVLRAGGAASERSLPFAALRDLLGQLPADLVATAPELDLRDLRDLAGPGEDGLTDARRSATYAAFHDLLERHAGGRRLLLLLDDVQWLDPESAGVIGYTRRRMRVRVQLVATVGPGEGHGADTAGLRAVEVPPLGADDMIELLGHHGLPAPEAHRLHVESGGVPALALALAGAVGAQPSVLGRRVPLPASLQRVLRERFLAQPAEVRSTLVHAALLHRPTVRQLERAGRLDAEAHVRAADQAGLVVHEDGAVRFTPSGLRPVILEAVPAAERAALHRALADAATSTAERARHRALADPRPDGALARELGAVARESAEAGAREIAAELYVLAADRAPVELADERVEWLATAVETAAPGNHVELVQRALADFLELRATPAQTVRVRLALPELAGSGVDVLDEVLTAALADAGDDDRLVAMVLLQRSRVALMESRPEAAAGGAGRAVELLERAGDREALAVGLTAYAVARRWLRGDHRTPLARAVALAGPEPSGLVHLSPGYMAARFAFYDDRLDEAWAAFRAMLSQVERGAGTDRVHVLRCLVEVGVRLGRCREAREYAGRAGRIAEEFGLDAHQGWFITALAELAGGDLALARTTAERGAEAAEARGDLRYLQRLLVLVGQARLRSGDAQGACAALGRIRDIERARAIADPTVNRWQHELVGALVATGRLEDAADLVAEAREALDGRSGTEGVGAQLDRAEAEVLTATGDLDGAHLLLHRAEKVTADLGMRLDLGRSLVARAHLERRRRRAAASRAALEAAEAVFLASRADSWTAQVRAELSPTRGRPAAGRDALLGQLTASEARVAAEVAQGASNREIAERTFVSVKTVEATLTRIYRKLDVRSRTQLATLVGPLGRPPAE